MSIPSKTAFSTSSKLLNASLWVAQTLVFIAFVLIGWMKLFKPIPELAAMWPWTGQLPVVIVRVLAVIDIAGGVGIFIPALMRIKPDLTVAAATGCMVLQICAMTFHISRGEIGVIPFNVIFLALSIFILWGRRKRLVQAR